VTRLLAAVAIALAAIGRAKGRALLTILGILIGVAAVVIVSALGTGVRERVMSQLQSLGSNAIFIWGRWHAPSGARRQQTGGRLSEGDGKAIVREATSVASVVPFLSAQVQVVAGDRNVSTSVIGSSRGYLDVRGYKLAHGSNFTETDDRLKTKVCVLGETVRQNLYGAGEAVGQVIRLGRYPFRVVGTLETKGQSPNGEDQDDKIMIPAGTFRSRVMPTPPGRVHFLIASATDARTVGRAQTQIDAILRQRHHIEEGTEPDFALGSQAEWIKAQEQIFGTLQALLLGIALVSLGVGGIGVMNIMLVSVRERTREIGIRMAIGARDDDVRFQFLVEAVVLCLIGGLLGIVIGIVAIVVLTRTLGWSMSLPPSAVVVAFGTAFTTGVVFGFWPARNAARLDPIEALHHE
jgi:putative ABC transport system permease protein